MEPVFIMIGDSIINLTEVTTAYEVEVNGNGRLRVEFKKGSYREVTGATKDDFFTVLQKAGERFVR